MSKNSNTSQLSVRLPTLEMRRNFVKKCEEDGISQAAFIRNAAEAYLEGRLQIIPKTASKKSYMA